MAPSVLAVDGAQHVAHAQPLPPRHAAWPQGEDVRPLRTREPHAPRLLKPRPVQRQPDHLIRRGLLRAQQLREPADGRRHLRRGRN